MDMLKDDERNDISMERKTKILTVVPIIILTIQLLFHVEYIWTRTVHLFYEFNMNHLWNICSYLFEIIAIVALLKHNKILLSIYWIFNATSPAEIMICVMVVLSLLPISQKGKDIIKKIYYIPILFYGIDELIYRIHSCSPVSSMISEGLLTVAYYCMVYWCVKIPDKQ